MLLLLALFVLVPIVELTLLIQLGRVVGLLPTLALIVATGALGAWLTRWQGLGALAEMQRELAEGRVPAAPLLDGILILVAGGVLLTPGLLTDVAGFLLLVPASRRWLRARLLARLERAVREGSVQVSWRFDVGGRGPAAGTREPEWEVRSRGGSERRLDEPPEDPEDPDGGGR